MLRGSGVVAVAPLRLQSQKNELRSILNAKRDRGVLGSFTRLISIKYVLPLVMCVGVALVGVLVWFISNYYVNIYNEKIMYDYQTTKTYEIVAKVRPYFSEILPLLPQMATLLQANASIPLVEKVMFSAMQNYDMRFIDVTYSDRTHTGFTRNTRIFGIQQSGNELNARYYSLDQTTGEHLNKTHPDLTYPFDATSVLVYQNTLGKIGPVYTAYTVIIMFNGQQHQERAISLSQEVCSSPAREYCAMVKLGLNTKDISVMIKNVHVSENGISFIMEPDRTVTADSIDPLISQNGLKTTNYPLQLVKLAGDTISDNELNDLLENPTNDPYKTFHHVFEDSKGDRYVVMFAPLIAADNGKGFSMRFVVGIIILENDFVGFMDNINKQTSIAVSLIVLGMGLIMSIFTYSIVKAINYVMRRMSNISKLEFDLNHGTTPPKPRVGTLQSMTKQGDGSPHSPGFTTPDDPIISIWEKYKHKEKKSLLIFDELKDLVRDSVKTEIAVYCASCYTPKGVIKHVLEGNIPMTTGMDAKVMTVLFADIMSFTTLCETYPQKIALATSEFDETMSRIIQAHKGVIGTYNGDNIIAWWNSPDEVEGHPYHACTAALACVAELNAMNARLRAKGFPVDIKFGIGLSYGMMYVGNIGFVDAHTNEVRLHYTIIGDRVNVAARLEGATREHNAAILVSEQLYEQVNSVPEFFFQKVGTLQLKGKKVGVGAYALTPTPASTVKRSGGFSVSLSQQHSTSDIDTHPFSTSQSDLQLLQHDEF